MRIRLALLPVAAAAILHSTFGRTQGMQLCRRWATSLELPTDQLYEATTVIRARLALEHPSSFLITAMHDEGLAGFVCVPVGRGAHRVDAVVWPAGAEEHGKCFQTLRRWHAARFAGHRLVPGSLARWEVEAWHEGFAP